MRRKALTFTALMVASVASLAVSKQAHAELVASPYGNQRVFVKVGYDSRFGPIVCFLPTDNPSTSTVYLLGNLNGLNQDYMIAARGGNDTLLTVSRSGQALPGCNPPNQGPYFFEPLVYGVNPANGQSWRLDMRGSSGKDTIVCGGGKSDCFGDTGDDDMQGFSGIGALNGNSGKDSLAGSSAITTDRLSGGPDNDCLEDPGDRHTRFDCGDGADTYVPPGSGRVSCETKQTLVQCPDPTM
jgi:Ca2+-binding RTX toxin-like protein